MKQKMKKSVLHYVTAIFCLTMLFGVTVQAGSMNPSNYFYVSVGMDISATATGQPVSVRNSKSIIIDWNQVVSSGGSVSASLSSINSTGISYPYPTVSSYSWKLVDKTGLKSTTRTGTSIYIPSTYAGGHLEVTANIVSDNTWIATEITSKVSIS